MRIGGQVFGTRQASTIKTNMSEKYEAVDKIEKSDVPGQSKPSGDLQVAPDANSDLLLTLSQTLADSDLLLTLYRTLIEHSDLASGLRSALEIVCKFASWDAGTAWLPTEDRQRIRLFVAWQQDATAFAEFIRSCGEQSFLPNVGIVGRVWAQRTTEWISDLTAQSPEAFPLAKHARAVPKRSTKAGLTKELGDQRLGV